MDDLIKITTDCASPVWQGWFTEPDECGNIIVVAVDDERDEWESDGDGGWFSPVVVQCEQCRCLLEWPQIWTLADDDAEERGVAEYDDERENSNEK